VDESRLRVRDEEPLRRRRLAVLFRALIFVPQYIVLSIWSLVALILFPFAWLVVLLLGRLPGWMHRFLAAFVRYSGQVSAWAHLLSGRYPDPLRTGEHPFAIDVPERLRQRRLFTLLRFILALPAIALTVAFRVVLGSSAIPAWFIAVVRGRTTAGLQELGTFCLRYELETTAYILLLTPRYPRLARE